MTAVLAQTHMYGWNGWWMGLGMLVFWVLVIGVVAAVVVAVTRSQRRGAGDDDTSRARALLAERYASGDIDTDEFQARSRELEKAAK
jgi:putative membrane protein